MSPSPGCAAPPGRPRRPGPAGPASRPAARAGPACRSGSAGWTRSAPKPAGQGRVTGRHAADVAQAGRRGVTAHSASARSFTSMAHTRAPGDRAASTRASGPYPQPRSSRSPAGGGGGAVSSSSRVPGSSRPGENIPASVRQRQVHVGQHHMHQAGPVRGVRLPGEVVLTHAVRSLPASAGLPGRRGGALPGTARRRGGQRRVDVPAGHPPLDHERQHRDCAGQQQDHRAPGWPAAGAAGGTAGRR